MKLQNYVYCILKIYQNVSKQYCITPLNNCFREFHLFSYWTICLVNILSHASDDAFKNPPIRIMQNISCEMEQKSKQNKQSIERCLIDPVNNL